MALSLIVALRLLVPLAILRWPFWGMLAAIGADAADVVIIDALDWGFGSAGRYHVFDKFADLYHLAFAAWASRTWPEHAVHRTGLLLFAWRAAGALVFAGTGSRQAMLFFPNVFENFYLLVAGLRQFAPAFRLDSGRKLAVALLIAAIPKIAQEYIMHFLEFPTWHFIKTTIFRWR